MTLRESLFLDQRIRAFPSEASLTQQTLIADVAKYGALPLEVGWTGVLALRPDGLLVHWSTDGDFEGAHNETQPVWTRVSRFLAARRFPALRNVLPRRPASASPCLRCRQLSKFPAILCSCGGLGWVVPQPETLDQLGLEGAWIQEHSAVSRPPESEELAFGLAAANVPARFFTAKQLARDHLLLGPKTLVAGEIPIVLSALRRLGVPAPRPLDYPVCLLPFLQRKVGWSTVGRVRQQVLNAGQEVFLKPVGGSKRFPGHVLGPLQDPGWLQGVGAGVRVLCSQVVAWRAEARFFVLRGRVVGHRWYRGQAESLDQDRIDKAVHIFQQSGQAPAGYAIDFGVLESGETALVELNDGFGLGSYGLEPDLYARLLAARWLELTSTA